MDIHGSYLPVFVFLSLLAIGVIGTIVWLIALIDCLKNEPSAGNDKVIWLLVIIFLHGLGAMLYLFVRRPQRISQYGH